jgi:PAS domain S-box-containing protein
MTPVCGAVAQLGERYIRIVEVGGSNPPSSIFKEDTERPIAPKRSLGNGLSIFSMKETTRGYIIALIATGVAFLIRWSLSGPLQADARLLLFTLAVIVSALWGGFAAGLLSTGLSIILGLIFFFPTYRLDTGDVVHLLTFLVIGVSVSAMARSVAIARSQAEESEQYLTSIIETTTSGLLVLDRNGFITFANPAAADLFGLMPSHLIGRRYDDPGWGAETPEGQPLQESEQPAARVLASGEGLSGVQMTVRRPDDSPLALIVNASPLCDEGGNVNGVVLALNRLSAHG